MAAAIGLREDYDAGALRALAKRAKDGPQARRLLALASIYDGALRSGAAENGGVGLQVIRDWVLRFNARGPDGLVDRKAPGQPSRLEDEHRAKALRDDHGFGSRGHVAVVRLRWTSRFGRLTWRLSDARVDVFESVGEICDVSRVTVARQTAKDRSFVRGRRNSG